MQNNAMRIRHEVGRKVAGDTILQECCNPGTWNVIRRVVTFLRDHATNLTARKDADGADKEENDMAEQPAPLSPGEPTPNRDQPAAAAGAAKDAPAPPDHEPIEPPMRASTQPAARQSRTRHPWDRYDAIGAAILLFVLALWVLHFLLPAPPPTDVP
jgi:hypothetical protein